MGLIQPIENSETKEIKCPEEKYGPRYFMCGDKSIAASSCVKIGQKDKPEGEADEEASNGSKRNNNESK